MIRLVSKSHRLQLFLYSILCIVLFTGCIGSKRVTMVVYEEKNRAVKLESRLGKDKKPIEYGYQHPAVINQKDFEILLSSVYVKKSKTLLQLLVSGFVNKDRDPAFSPEEVIFLAPHLSDALAEAKPTQRATFVLWQPHGAQTREITSGAIFIRENRLNLVLANDRTAVDRDKMPAAEEDDALYVYEPDDFKMLPGKHQELVKPDQKGNLDGDLPKTWVAMDYQQILASPLAAAPQMTSGPSPQTSPQTPPTESNPPPGQTLPQNSSGPLFQKPPQVQSIEPVPVSPLEEKLRVLKRLREQGLITEEEYQAKKQELLKTF